MTTSDPVTAPDMVSVVQAAVYKARWVDNFGREPVIATDEAIARAVLAAISEAGTVEWGVQLSESFTENHHGSRRGAEEAAKETGSHVITRVTLPWERAE